MNYTYLAAVLAALPLASPALAQDAVAIGVSPPGESQAAPVRPVTVSGSVALLSD